MRSDFEKLSSPDQELTDEFLSRIPDGSIVFLLGESPKKILSQFADRDGNYWAAEHVFVKGSGAIVDASIGQGVVRKMPGNYIPQKIRKYYSGFLVLSPPST